MVDPHYRYIKPVMLLQNCYLLTKSFDFRVTLQTFWWSSSASSWKFDLVCFALTILSMQSWFNLKLNNLHINISPCLHEYISSKQNIKHHIKTCTVHMHGWHKQGVILGPKFKSKNFNWPKLCKTSYWIDIHFQLRSPATAQNIRNILV